MSRRLRFFIEFLAGTATAAFLTHYVAGGRLPWWPRTLLIGGFLGALMAAAGLALEEELQTVEEIMRIEESEND